MADRKMTLKQRSVNAWASAMTLGECQGLWLAGWHARGRADRVTKAERINRDALQFLIDLKAHVDHQRELTPWMKDSAEVAALRKRLAKLIERAKGRK